MFRVIIAFVSLPGRISENTRKQLNSIQGNTARDIVHLALYLI